MSHDEMLNYFSALIQKHIGIEYRADNFFQLESRLHDVAKSLNLNSLSDLYQYAASGFQKNDEQIFFDAITNNETSFFRDAKVFSELTTQIVERLKTTQQAEFRIWSAACSSGQESVTMAISIKEAMVNYPELQNIKITIFCTDVCQRVLSKAEKGEYTQLEVQRGMPAKYLVKYFTKDINDRWQINHDLLKNIKHQKHNLRIPIYSQESFDLILCRNVLIYQNIEGKKLIVDNLQNNLKAEGFLILGSGESLLGINSNFDYLQKDSTLIYKKKLGLKKMAA